MRSISRAGARNKTNGSRTLGFLAALLMQRVSRRRVIPTINESRYPFGFPDHVQESAGQLFAVLAFKLIARARDQLIGARAAKGDSL